MKENLSKLLAVVILIIVVIAVILIKHRTKSEKSMEGSALVETQITPQIPSPSSPSEEFQITQTQEDVKAERPPQDVQPEAKSEEIEPDNNILAVVNNFNVTKDYFEKKYQALPEPQKDVFKKNKEMLLDQLIVSELLYQEAKNIGFAKDLSNESDVERNKEAAIEQLVVDIVQKIKIPEEEMKNFYNARKGEMGGASFEQVKPQIKQFLVQQEQGEVIEQYIEDLKASAKIVKNERWVKEQKALLPQNPLDAALTNGKPTVLDLGAGHCIPCKMMKPIFEELEKEYKGKANIILLEISDHRDLSYRYKVRVIPTQIFFDKSGNVSWRHEGFLSKDEIIKKLEELGVE